MFVPEPLEAERDRHELFAVDVNVRSEEVVPRLTERLDGNHRKRWLDERQNNGGVDTWMAAAVNFGCVLKVFRNRHHELPQQEYAERVPEQRAEPQRSERVVPAELVVDEEDGDHGDLGR